MDLGLGRIKKFLDTVENPQDKINTIHVTGTNGKGSVCAYLSSIFHAAGYKVARFTSPHLVDWRECIVVDEQCITEEQFNNTFERISFQMKFHDICLTQFEALTAGAFSYFWEQHVDVAIIEVGRPLVFDFSHVCTFPS